MYLPWTDISLQGIYQTARRYLFVNCPLQVRILDDDSLQFLLLVGNGFNWTTTAQMIRRER